MEDELIKKSFKEMKKKLPKGGKCPDEDDLARFAEGIMDEGEAKKIKEHLLLCSKCCDDYATLTMALNKVDSFPPEEDLPEVSDKQMKRVYAIADDKDKKRHSPSGTISSNLENITQSIKDFFSFDWRMQPIPVAVKSGAMAFLVILIISTSYVYYQQGDEIILQMDVIGKVRVTSERGIPKEEIIEKIIKEGDTLSSGDHFQIKFGLDQDAYVYVLIYDSVGKLYPAPEVEIPLKVKGKEKHTILPDEKRGYKLGDNIGEETVIILASDKPIRNFQETLNSFQGLPLEQVLKALKTKATVVKTLSFKHQ